MIKQIPLTISIERNLLEWIDTNHNKLGFRNRSHMIEIIIKKYMEMNENGRN